MNILEDSIPIILNEKSDRTGSTSRHPRRKPGPVCKLLLLALKAFSNTMNISGDMKGEEEAKSQEAIRAP